MLWKTMRILSAFGKQSDNLSIIFWVCVCTATCCGIPVLWVINTEEIIVVDTRIYSLMLLLMFKMWYLNSILDDSSFIVPKFETDWVQLHALFLPNLELFCIIISEFKAQSHNYCVLFPYIKFSYGYSWSTFMCFCPGLVSYPMSGSIQFLVQQQTWCRRSLDWKKKLFSFKFAWDRILVLKSLPLRRKISYGTCGIEIWTLWEGGLLASLAVISRDTLFEF